MLFSWFRSLLTQRIHKENSTVSDLPLSKVLMCLALLRGKVGRSQTRRGRNPSLSPGGQDTKYKKQARELSWSPAARGTPEVRGCYGTQGSRELAMTIAWPWPRGTTSPDRGTIHQLLGGPVTKLGMHRGGMSLVRLKLCWWMTQRVVVRILADPVAGQSTTVRALG